MLTRTKEKESKTMWLPIDEKTPRDGTLIDVWAYGERYPDVRFDTRRKTWMHYSIDSYDRMDWVVLTFKPTHWMPVPDPPSS
jgi:hypothetical protein